MANFQTNLIYISLFILGGALIYTGYLMHQNKTSRRIPPVVSRCPDFFELQTVTNNNKQVEKCVDTRGIYGSVKVTPISLSEAQNLTEEKRKAIITQLKGVDPNITWDGVTYTI